MDADRPVGEAKAIVQLIPALLSRFDTIVGMQTEFLSSLYAYPWDLHDEGLDKSLGRILEMTACKEVMLTPAYHVSTYFLPHNPARMIYWGEDGAVYFRPNQEYWRNSYIRPRLSNLAEGKDYFQTIVTKTKERGLLFSAWIVYLFNHHLASEHPQYARADVFGNRYTNAHK
jgi:hypothetical protein